MYVVLARLAGLALVLSLGIRGYDLNRESETEQFWRTKTEEKGRAEGTRRKGMVA